MRLHLGLLLSVALLAPAGAAPLDDAHASGKLRVGTPGDYAPFSLRQLTAATAAPT